MIIRLLISLIPFWTLKRLLLCRIFKYYIHPSAFIGFSYVFPDFLFMSKGSRIGHGTICKGLASLKLGRLSSIGNLNWITGFPRGSASKHYANQPNRDPKLVLAKHSAITNRHLVDCTHSVFVGEYTIVAGFGSQLLTHSVDFASSSQVASPIIVGKRSFVGTRSIVLPGCRIASYVVVAAGSVVANDVLQSYFLYGGCPARCLKQLPHSYQFFLRSSGYIY